MEVSDARKLKGLEEEITAAFPCNVMRNRPTPARSGRTHVEHLIGQAIAGPKM
jgi:hypothetical protein